MTALATVADVAVVSRAVPDDEVDRVERLLEMVSARVRRYTGQTFDLVEDDEIVVWPVDGEVRLPQRPVVSVASVAEFGVGTLASGFYDAKRDGRLFRIYNQYPQPWRYGKLTVTYTHGYEEIPDDIVMVVAEVTAERWNAAVVNPKQIGSTSRDVGGYTESQTFRFPGDSREAWSAEHLEILDSYRPAKVGSVRIS